MPFDLTLGLDNVFVALALGPVLNARRAVLLGCLFGAFGFVASASGCAIHGLFGPSVIDDPGVSLDILRAATIVMVGVAILGFAFTRIRPVSAGTVPALAGLAVLLSVDDFVGGLGLDVSAGGIVRLAVSALATGVLSIAAAAAGAVVGRRLKPRLAAIASACALLGVAVAGFV